MTTFAKGPDLIAVALAGTFAAYLPAEITDLNAAWNDPSTVPALIAPKVYYSERHFLDPGMPDLPALMVGMLQGKQSANAANNANAGYGAISYQWEAMLYLISDKLEIAERWGRRYATAMWEVIMKHQGLDYITPGQKSVDGLSGVDLLDIGFTSNQRSEMVIEYIASVSGLVYVLQGVGSNS